MGSAILFLTLTMPPLISSAFVIFCFSREPTRNSLSSYAIAHKYSSRDLVKCCKNPFQRYPSSCHSFAPIGIVCHSVIHFESLNEPQTLLLIPGSFNFDIYVISSCPFECPSPYLLIDVNQVVRHSSDRTIKTFRETNLVFFSCWIEWSQKFIFLTNYSFDII